MDIKHTQDRIELKFYTRRRLLTGLVFFGYVLASVMLNRHDTSLNGITAHLIWLVLVGAISLGMVVNSYRQHTVILNSGEIAVSRTWLIGKFNRTRTYQKADVSAVDYALAPLGQPAVSPKNIYLVMRSGARIVIFSPQMKFWLAFTEKMSAEYGAQAQRIAAFLDVPMYVEPKDSWDDDF